MKKVLHIITGLESGGAEKTLINLVLNDKLNNHYIFSLKDFGKYKKVIKKNKINVKIFNLKFINFFYVFYKVSSEMKKFNPHLVITWMYHADFFGGLVSKINKIKYIYWNVRGTTLSNTNTKFITRYLRNILSLLSYFIPSKIIYCALSAKKVHERIGYIKKSVFIPNGIDTNFFKPSNRKKYNYNSYFKIGYLARWDKQKNFKLALQSIQLLKKHIPNFKFFLAGEDMTRRNKELISMIKFYNLEKDVILLGEIKNMPKLYNSLDLTIMTSSYGEAFPNVLAESMSCGIPCISTNIGDASNIVGKYGWICNSYSPNIFKTYLIKAINLKKNNHKKWINLKKNCRVRIESKFSLKAMLENYQNLIKK